MILEYDRSPGASSDQKIQTLMESVQRAFNNIDAGTLTGNMSTLVRINGGSLFGIIDGDYVFVKNLDADSIKAVNAWVDKLLVQTNLLANDGQVYTLDAIEVNAANITAGTIDVQRIILTIDGQKYMFDPRGHYEKTKDTTIVAGKTYYVRTGTDPDYEYIAVDNPVQADIGTYYEFLTYEKLDGDVIEDLTITADKIVSGSIMTRHITTQDIEGTSGWINLRNGTFFYGNGVNFATADNAIWWDGSKLKIKADDFLLSSGKSIFDEIDEIETWFYATDPTLSNEPAVNWTTYEAKQMHLRDIYYNTDSGHSFRWAVVEVDNPTGNPSTSGYLELVNGEYVPSTDTSVDPLKTYYTFGWMEIVDADLEAALERLSAAETAISQNADSIVSLASANATYTTPSGNTATNALTTKITQTATSIESLAANNATYTKPDGTTGTNAMQSAISQNASNISLKVSKDNVIGEINLSPEAATISADKINIAGTITAINNDSTTTIDGDKITTGTLSASAIDATSGTFATANIPDLNASKITAGNISADRMKTNAISAINADLTSATINSAHIPNLSADKITSGNITADRMKTNAISAINLDTSSATINEAHIPSLSANKIDVLTKDGTSGVYLHPSGQSPSSSAPGNSVSVSGNGLEVFKGGTSVAFYGDTARIGKPNVGHIEIDNTNLHFYNNTTMFGRIRKGYYDRQMQIGTWKDDYTYGSLSLDGDDGKAVLTVQSGTSSSDNYSSLTMTPTAGSFTLGSDTSTSSSFDAILQLTTNKLALYYGGVYDSDIKLSVIPSTGQLTLAGHSSPIGSKVNGTKVDTSSTAIPDSINVTTGNGTSIAQLVLTKGTWIVYGQARFESNSTGYRRMGLSTSKNAASLDVTFGASSSGATQIANTRVLSPSSQTTYYLNVTHNGGATLAVSDITFAAWRLI